MSRTRATLINRILRHAAHPSRPGGTGRLSDFLRAYFARVPVEDLAARRPEDLAGAALAHLKLARHWTRRPRSVRVYNPDPRRDGWSSDHTVVELVTHDSPFLVDSVTMEVNRQGFMSHLLIHPLLELKRDRHGAIRRIRPADDAGEDARLTSFIHVEIKRETGAERLRHLQDGLEVVLEDVRAAVRDWRAIVDRVQAVIGRLEQSPPALGRRLVQESAEYLRWLLDDNFTFLGYREYDLVQNRRGPSLRVTPGSGLGILRERKGATRSSAFDKLPAQLKRRARERTLLMLTKSNSRSTVHRPVYLDYVGVKRYSPGGRVVGECRILGLYTSKAYLSTPGSIPLIRRKIDAVLRQSGFLPRSHAGKALLNVLDTYPRDELLQAGADDLLATAMGIIDLQERQRVRVFIRRDEFERYCACLVFVPKERFHSGVREQIQAILRRSLNAAAVEFETTISQSVYAELYLTAHTTPGAVPSFDVDAIEAEVAAATRTWSDDLHVELVKIYGEERGNNLARRFRDAFPAAYRDDHSPIEAVEDLRRVETAIAAAELQLKVYRDPGMAPEQLGFKLYSPGAKIQLSAALPILENMGLFVISQTPYEIEPGTGPSVWLHDFGMRRRDGQAVDLALIQDKFHEAFAQIWDGRVENDSFNRLVLGAGLGVREITLLRAYSKYMRQIGTAFSQAYIEDTLNRHAGIAALLVALFLTRFDPEAGSARARRVQSIERRIEKRLDAVESLDDDRILRRFYDLLHATLRTNYFQQIGGQGAKGYLSFKLASRQIPDLDPPYPRFEIFVYSPRVEGVHLRGGKVARGGLRWSDRREDFRTEILGLMQAQMVKNAVIVPVGAKGGFYVKRPPADRVTAQAEGIECYKIFVRGLLDITDNRVGDTIVAPPAVVRYDEDDPYLVVAADKGTAQFSDIANSVSAEYGFWLGDAFASGGSAGYDHKQMGITARGAWESVLHHFQFLRVDIRNTDFTVVGIGDMAGDVFGNGMLMSPRIRLVGAFNHMHIFLDPDPDRRRSFGERKRLFELPGSTWADYKRELISRGGGVYPRAAKSISLSPEVKHLLGVDADSANPSELIRMLLQAPVDLLWNGGIGAYVKAEDEQHSAVGDKSNDTLRVNATRLRCKVIGEGGNLGVTQRGRIEFAQRGGRLNADWIDNSGGVDCSDREVNIKILLNGALAAGLLRPSDRNALLRRMTDEVAKLVLRDNYRQARVITTAELESRKRPGWYGELLHSLDRIEDFSRAQEFLPDAAALERRRAAQQGLCRPEIAMLLAHTKTALYREILGSDLPDDVYMNALLSRYFPKPLREKFPEQIRMHQLRREIIATVLSNSMVNRAGITYGHRLADETGAGIPEIARAYLVARDVFAIPALWEGIDRLEFKVPVEGQVELVFETQHLLRHASRWFLHNSRYLADMGAAVERFRAGAVVVEGMLEEITAQPEWDFLRQQAEQIEATGVPPRTASRFAALRVLIATLEITRLAESSGLALELVAAAYFGLGRKVRIHVLERQASRLTTQTVWQDRARTDLLQELLSLQGDLAADALRDYRRGQGPEQIVERWFAARQVAFRRYEEVAEHLQEAEQVELAMLSVALSKLRIMQAPAAAG